MLFNKTIVKCQPHLNISHYQLLRKFKLKKKSTENKEFKTTPTEKGNSKETKGQILVTL